MKKIIIRDNTLIPPFNEPARDLRIMNKPLWLFQRDVMSTYCREEFECKSFEEIATLPKNLTQGETVIYRDNLFFNEGLFESFLIAARKTGKPSQIAFSKNDTAIVNHSLPLQSGIRPQRDLYVADLYYFPDGNQANIVSPEPVIINTEPREMGYYNVPTYMANQKGELGYHVPLKPFLSIESWVHIFTANITYGVFSHGAKVEKTLDHFPTMMKVLWRSLVERKQFLSSSALVLVGKNTQIAPEAIVQGPSIIGNNVVIGPGSVINASIIGNDVNIMQGVQLLLSVVGDGSYLGFRAALFMTTLMERAMVAQNTCLQLSVVGRHSFVGAGNTFTDFRLMPRKTDDDDPDHGFDLKVWHKGKLQKVEMPVLGGCVGHNCRIGSGHVFYPARTVASDVVMHPTQGRTIITKNVAYSDSDHHAYPDSGHIPLYHDE